MGRLIDLTDKGYGRLTVVERVGSNKHSQALWRCECECGGEVISTSGDLNSGHTKSCGCLKRENTFKHGFSRHPLYSVWKDMKQRCYNEKSSFYHNYGGRGITVCDEWMDSPKSFIEWCLLNGWEKGLEIDRSNNNGNYEPSNCRFVTKRQNGVNTRPKGGVSKYKGVTWSKKDKRWIAKIKSNNKTLCLGYFRSEMEAAKAYDRGAEELHGEYAWLNKDNFEELQEA